MFLFLLCLFLFSSAVEVKDYTIVVRTSNDHFAGTDAIVKVRVHGTLGIIERELAGLSDSFERGSTDIFVLQDDIGFVTGMDVYRNNDGFMSDWKLDKIIIRTPDVPDSIFNYFGWVPKYQWISLSLSCPPGTFVNDYGFCFVQE